MKQVLAVAAAALLVAVAIVVRGALDDDGDDDGGGPGPDEELVVACVPELREACEAMGAGARIEDPTDTIADVGTVDAWVTFDPWPAIAELRDPEAALRGTPVPVASSELVLLTRTEALPDGCDTPPDWACVAAATGSAAATLPPATSALGALLLGHAAGGWSATTRPGEPFARNDFVLPEFQAWHAALQFERDPVEDMLLLGRAGPVATGTTRATFEVSVQDSRERDNLDATPTAVRATVAVVVAGEAAQLIASDEDLLAGLEALGWDLDPEASTTGLPNAGVLFALQEIP